MTLPVTAETDCLTAEEFVAYAARVSNPANQNNTGTADKLIRYLIKNHHWSPFEMVSITIEINTTRDIGRQILRHRSFAFQEFSGRYAINTTFVTREARLQDSKNRQNSIRTDDGELHTFWDEAQDAVSQLSQGYYEEAIKRGIAKEQARALLPEGMTGTRMYMAGTLRSWIHYCQLRCANGTQAEHMEIADAAWAAIGQHFPNVIKAIGEMNCADEQVTPTPSTWFSTVAARWSTFVMKLSAR
jgi:thymidylate synthase (FAD)